MKTKLFLIVFFLSGAVLFAGNGYNVSFDEHDNAYHLNFSVDEISISTVEIDGNTWSVINYPGSVVTSKAGFAELPFIHAAVMLEEDNSVKLSYEGVEYIDYELEYPLLPSRGVIYRDQDPSEIPYVIDPKSITNTWYPGELANNTEPYILRDVRGTNVYAYPFQYNAQRNVVRVYYELKVVLENKNSSPVNPLNRQSNEIVYEMDAIYHSIFINYGHNRDDLTIGEMGDILVVVTNRDEAAMDPYIQWKREKGYNVTVEIVGAGTNVNSLVQSAYDANNDLLYVQLVGDWADIKCNTLGSGAPMDPQVGCVAGGDEVPDIAVGRFSAENPTHVTTQVNKVITYEKTPQSGASWYQVATGIGSHEGPGDDGEDDWEHLDVIYNDKYDPFTFEGYNDIYDPGASTGDVFSAVNGGTSVINYTGHGWPQGWSTSGFSNSNVASLSNGDMTPWAVSVACNNGDFHTGTCFAEAWQRHDGGGSVMFLGASISQPWNPPMRGQDYFADILIGGYDYSAHSGQSGINTTEGRTTLGAIVFNGLVLMTTESGGSSDWETAKTWNLFGDPSMQARTDIPAELTLSSDLIMVGIPYETTITANGNPVEGAMVTISQNDTYFTAITDASGMVSIPHTLSPGDALLVVTAFNTETVYQTVSVVPSSGAYVIYDSHVINDASSGNGNGMLDYGEAPSMTIALSNVGSADANNVQVSLSTSDPYVTITDGEENYGTIPAGQTVQVDDAFGIQIANDIPDGHYIQFEIESVGDATWNSAFSDMGYAPVLELGTYVIDDASGNGNGKIDPGETVNVIISVENNGGSDADGVVGMLNTTSEHITIVEASMPYGLIPAGGMADQVYEVTSSATTPAGHSAPFSFDISANLGRTGYGEFFLIVGQIPVLVIDLDGNNNSADVMMTCFENLSVGADVVEGWPDDLNLYSSVFVCLGVYPDNYTLSNAEGQELADFLNAGGRVYMEGGDTWAYDDPTPVHSLFNINGVEDGADDLATILGQDGTFTEGMTFSYSGDGSWIDRLAPIDDAFTVLKNSSPSYNTTIAYDEGTYKTIGSSSEFGGLQAAPSPVEYLMHQYLEFFDITSIWVGVSEAEELNAEFGQPYPNPFTGKTFINFKLEADQRISVDIYNMSGQKVSALADSKFEKGSHQLSWKADEMPEGVYFMRIIAGEQVITRKVIRIK
jgi:hypothetical protein